MDRSARLAVLITLILVLSSCETTRGPSKTKNPPGWPITLVAPSAADTGLHRRYYPAALQTFGKSETGSPDVTIGSSLHASGLISGLVNRIENTGVNGKVVDKSTGEALVGIRIDFIFRREVVATMYSGVDGTYDLPLVVSGHAAPVSLEFSSPNYTFETREVVLPPGKPQAVAAALSLKYIAPGSATGVITDAVSGVALVGARVVASGAATPSTTSNEFGVYQFPALPEGAYTLLASADGHEGQFRRVEVRGPNTVQSDFALISGRPTSLLADIDGNGHVDATDIQLVINAALGLATMGSPDIDLNGIVNALDIQFVINSALGIYQTSQ